MKIGDIARRAGCTVETIRYYEREGLLPRSERGANNYRLYDPAHLETLLFIRNCRVLEMSLEEIAALLRLKRDREEDCGEVNAILEAHIAHVTERIESLKSLKAQLKALRNSCGRIQPRKSCAILRGLAEPAKGGQPGQDGKGTHVHGAH